MTPVKFPEARLIVADVVIPPYEKADAVAVHADATFHIKVNGTLREIAPGTYHLAPSDAPVWIRAGAGRVRVC